MEFAAAPPGEALRRDDRLVFGFDVRVIGAQHRCLRRCHVDRLGEGRLVDQGGRLGHDIRHLGQRLRLADGEQELVRDLESGQLAGEEMLVDRVGGRAEWLGGCNRYCTGTDRYRYRLIGRWITKNPRGRWSILRGFFPIHRAGGETGAVAG